jgi:hypothetical protein
VTAFIGEFNSYIEQQFLGVRDMTERDHIIAEMTKSPDTVRAALEVISAGRDFKNTLIKELEDQLREQSSREGWTLTTYGIHKGKGSNSRIGCHGFSIRYQEANETSFSLEFSNTDRSEVTFGISGIDRNDPKYDDASRALNSAFGRPWRTTQTWPWNDRPRADHKVLSEEPDWNSSPRPWLAIADKTLAPKIVAAAKAFYDVLSKSHLLDQRSSS